MERCRKRMDQFLADLVEPIGRSERRHWAAVYVRGLLLDGERKSIEPLAARLPEGNVQALRQFIGQSPWEWDAVWERLPCNTSGHMHDGRHGPWIPYAGMVQGTDGNFYGTTYIGGASSSRQRLRIARHEHGQRPAIALTVDFQSKCLSRAT